MDGWRGEWWVGGWEMDYMLDYEKAWISDH